MLLTALGVAVALGAQPDSLTLEAALALARTNRGQLAAAAALTAAARADFRVAGAIPNPTAAYSYTGNAPREHATIDQPLDWLLRRGPDRATARAGIAAALADSARLSALVDRETRTAFFGALATQQRLTLAAEEAALADSLAAIAARRRAGGEISALEEAQALLEAARAHQLVSQAREDAASAAAELDRALGTDTRPLPPLAGALDRDLGSALPPSAPLEDLPVIVRARADSARGRAAMRAVQAARVPFPSLQAGLEWNDPTVQDQRATVLIGLSLPLPLWQTGGGLAAAARGRADEAAAQLQEVRAAARSALTQTTVRLQETARRAVLARDSILPIARRQRELALSAYQAGETGFAAVLDALRAERAVARDLVTDLLTFQAARADWLELIGETP